MKKKKSASIDLKTMWDRASKTREIGFGSTSTSQLVTIESEAVPNVPSVQSITVESQIHIQSVPSVEDEPEIPAISVVGVVTEPEPEVASNDPNIASTTTPTATTEHEQQQPEPSTWSPIRDDDSEADYQSSEDAVYDIDLLPHDPGRRIPIKRYDVNERNSVIRGYIAMGPCRPRNHNFPSALMNGLSSTNQTLSERKAVVESYRTLAASMQALITGHLLSVSSNLISSEMFC